MQERVSGAFKLVRKFQTGKKVLSERNWNPGHLRPGTGCLTTLRLERVDKGHQLAADSCDRSLSFGSGTWERRRSASVPRTPTTEF
jgi:hypothetical protein